MVALIASFLLALALTGAIVVYARRRPVGKPVSWGEAMAAATFVFFLMFWVYGVVPHQWLTWADNELGWRSDSYIFGPSSSASLPIIREIPFNFSFQALRDVVAVGIYGFFLAGHVALWAIWQSRGETAERRRKALESQTTQYGRPLARKT